MLFKNEIKNVKRFQKGITFFVSLSLLCLIFFVLSLSVGRASYAMPGTTTNVTRTTLDRLDSPSYREADYAGQILLAASNSLETGVRPVLRAIEEFLEDNSWDGRKEWGFSTTEEISIIVEENSVRAVIPGVAVIFKFANSDVRVEVGDIELRFKEESEKHIRITVETPSRVKMLSHKGVKLAEITIGSAQVYFVYNSSLKTIIGSHIEFLNVSSFVGKDLFARVKKIVQSANLAENPDGMWSGNMTFLIQELNIGGTNTVEEIKYQTKNKNVRLPELTSAVKAVEPDGMFGSWYFGSLYFPVSIFDSVTVDNAISIIDAARKIELSRGYSSLQGHIQEVSVGGLFSVRELRIRGNDNRGEDGLRDFRLLLDYEELHPSERGQLAELTELVPQEFHVGINIKNVPVPALLDYALIITKGILASDMPNLKDIEKKNVLEKLLLLNLGSVVESLSNAQMQINIENLFIKSSSYEGNLKGAFKAMLGTKLGFLGRMEFDISNGETTIGRLMKISHNNNYNDLLSTLTILKEMRKRQKIEFGPSIYVYEFTIGHDGHKRLNGADLGLLLPDIDLNLPSISQENKVPPLTIPKELGTNTDFESRLLILKTLYEKGLINKEEFDAKRKQILDAL